MRVLGFACVFRLSRSKSSISVFLAPVNNPEPRIPRVPQARVFGFGTDHGVMLTCE
jgi:hypothetical protein